MKFSNKISMTIGLSAMLFSAVVSTSMAATYVCSKAEVVKTGPSSTVSGGVALQLKCIDAAPVFGTIMVVPHADITDQVLATALTAVSLNKTVYVKTGGIVTGSALYTMYLNK